jgi:hypothetical protein
MSDEDAARIAPSSESLDIEDEFNLVLDRGDNVYVLVISGVLGSGGFVSSDGAHDIGMLRRAFATRVAGIPRLMSTLVSEPGGHRLVDRGIDIDLHVRSSASVAGLDEFRMLCAGLASTRLPTDRPLWEFVLVRIEAERKLGWVFRVHHAIADGATAARMLHQLFDERADHDVSTVGVPHRKRRQRGREMVARPLQTLAEFSHRLPRSALLGELGLQREARFFAVPLGAASRAAHEAGVTINDILLAAVGEGACEAFDFLRVPTPRCLPVAVPVLLPDTGDATNRVSVVVVAVPLDDTDVIARARAVRQLSRAAIAQARVRSLPIFVRTRSGARLMRWYIVRQRRLALNCTNVRGPAQRESICGAPIESVQALPVLSGNVRFGVAALSYAGTLSVTALWSNRLGAAGARFADRIASALSEAVGQVRTEPGVPSD